MQWSDARASRPDRQMRQFAGLSLVVFGGLAVWRAAQGDQGGVTVGLAAFGLVIGLVGVWRPSAVRPLFQAWMIAAFPIGWVVSRLMLAVLFFGMFTPIAIIFRLMGRDALDRRGRRADSYWQVPPAAVDPRDYFRQS